MNLKKHLLSFGLLTVTSSTALSVVGCSCGAPRDNTDEQIVNFINSYVYETEIVENSTYQVALNQLTLDIIKFELPTTLRNKFKDNAFNFTLNKSIINAETGEELNDNSFDINNSPIIAKFTYDYGKFKNQTANLKIPIIHDDDKRVIDGINNHTYKLDFEINSTYDDLTNKITGDDNKFKFIKDGLDNNTQPMFQDTHFKLNNVTDDNWRQLTKEDFEQFGEMTVKINYRYGEVEQETTFLQLKVIAKDEANIVAGINAVTNYETHLPIGSKYDDLFFNISSNDFIKEKLSAELQANFSDSALNIIDITNRDTGEKIKDTDFDAAKTINAKINYDYGTTKDQSTDLTIYVEKKLLSIELKDFEVRDRKNIVGFLDGNSLSIISKEIEDYLSIPSFVEAGLYFDEQTPTSVVVKAIDTSENYTGEIKITWKLKLFEIWGLGVTGAADKDLTNGLKGYFYLENEDQGITLKYFNVYGFLTGNNSRIHPYFNNYHKMTFKNEDGSEYSFTFNGNWKTDEVGTNFKDFIFTFNNDTGREVTIYSPGNNGNEAQRIKFFDMNTEQWVGTVNNNVYSIDKLGKVKKK